MSQLKELVDLIGTLEYRQDIPDAASEFARRNRLVICYGHSDDRVEFDGAVSEEYSAYEGTTIFLWPECQAPKLPCEREHREECPLFKHSRPKHIINALWCATEDASWTFETDIPTEEFTIMEDGEVFCRGIVFSLDDI